MDDAETLECCICEEGFEPDDPWDTDGKCPHCGTDLEWDLEGGTEEGFSFSRTREG